MCIHIPICFLKREQKFLAIEKILGALESCLRGCFFFYYLFFFVASWPFSRVPRPNAAHKYIYSMYSIYIHIYEYVFVWATLSCMYSPVYI